jgi:hypothetical protein
MQKSCLFTFPSLAGGPGSVLLNSLPQQGNTKGAAAAAGGGGGGGGGAGGGGGGGAAAGGGGGGVLFFAPLFRVRVEFAQAREALLAVLAGVAAYNICVAAPSEEPPGMRAQPAVDLIPPAAVHGEGLLEIAAPELSVCRGLAGKQTCDPFTHRVYQSSCLVLMRSGSRQIIGEPEKERERFSPRTHRFRRPSSPGARQRRRQPARTC